MSVSRAEFLQRMQVVRIVDDLLQAQYEAEEEAYWRREEHANERSEDWHLSFHASSFPINSRLSCPRQALYGLMAIPHPEPTSRFLRAVMEAGQDIEARILSRFIAAGILVSGHGDEQTNFRLKKYWLNGSIDAIIVPPEWNRPHVVEIKTKKLTDIEAMIAGERDYDEKHYGQIQVYIHGVRIGHHALGFADKGMEPCRDGTILYIARDNPSKTFEFFVEYNEEAVQSGLAKLSVWKDAFIANELIERPSTYMWSKQPCQYCAVKKLCKQDFENNVGLLSNSSAVDFAKQFDGSYDLDVIRKSIIDYWSN